MSRTSRMGILLAVILTAFALRLYRLDALPLRGDEAFAVQNWARLPLAESLSRIATIEPHPVLTYATFRIWGLIAGTEELTMRYLPALVSLIGLPALYGLGCRLGSRRLGLLAALFWAFNPYQIWHAQDARNYAIWSGLSLVSLWLGLRAVQRRQRTDWLLYTVAIGISVNVFYFEIFIIAAFGLYLIFARQYTQRVRFLWAAAVLPALLVAAMTFLVFQGQLIASGSYAGTLGKGLDFPLLWNWFLPTLMFGETVSSDLTAFIWPFVLVVVIIGLWVILRRDRADGVFVLLIAVIPLLVLSILSLRLDIFTPRYVLAAAPAYVLGFSAAVLGLGLSSERQVVRLLFGGLLIFFWFGVTLFSLVNYYFVIDYAKAKDWPQVALYLRERVTANDIVIQLSADAAFGFYYDAPAPDIALPDAPSQSANAIINKLTVAQKQAKSLWLAGQTFPDWPNAGIVEGWAAENMQLVRSASINGLNVWQYKTWHVTPDELVPASLAVFPGLTELVGMQVLNPSEPNGDLVIWLYWRPIGHTSQPQKVFLHLAGDINPASGTPLWSQDDQYPQNGRISTTDWKPAAIYRDVYTLPVASIPAGVYQFILGFYDPQSGERFRLADGSDSFPLRTINLP